MGCRCRSFKPEVSALNGPEACQPAAACNGADQFIKRVVVGTAAVTNIHSGSWTVGNFQHERDFLLALEIPKAPSMAEMAMLATLVCSNRDVP